MSDRAQLENHVDTRAQQRIHENRSVQRNGAVVRDNVPSLKEGKCEAVLQVKELNTTKPADKKRPKDDLSHLGRID